MAKADQAYHKRDLYTDVTARQEKQRSGLKVDRGLAVPNPFYI